MSAHPQTIRKARQQWARNLIARHRRAIKRSIAASWLATHSEERIRIRRALTKLEAQLMEALTER